MRRIVKLQAKNNWMLEITFESGEVKEFDIKPLLHFEAFEELQDQRNFAKIHNRGYFVEWDCETDLSADTLYCDGVLMKQ